MASRHLPSRVSRSIQSKELSHPPSSRLSSHIIIIEVNPSDTCGGRNASSSIPNDRGVRSSSGSRIGDADSERD